MTHLRSFCCFQQRIPQQTSHLHPQCLQRIVKIYREKAHITIFTWLARYTSDSRRSGLEPLRSHCIVFLHWIPLPSNNVSLHSGVQMDTSEFNAGGDPTIDWHPIQGGVKRLLVALWYRNRDTLRRHGPLGPTRTLHVSLPSYSCPLLLVYYISLQTTK